MAPNGYRDYFKILGLERSADAEAIKRAFRKNARKYHPDVNPGNAGSEEKFKEINEAYEVLSDPDKRKRYEQFGQYWNQVGNNGSSSNSGKPFDIEFGGYGNFDDFINDLLGKFGNQRGPSSVYETRFSNNSVYGKGPSRTNLSLDAEISLKLSFSEAFKGTERNLSVNEERVQVAIPKGVKKGSKLRLRGKGNLHSGTGRRGDLYLNLDIQSHEVWKLDGDQLKADLPVSLDELALGATISVMTPDGEAKLSIPQGTNSGTCLRLKGKGWPKKDGRGDLIFTVYLDLPNSWSNDEQRLLEELQRIRNNDPRETWLKLARL